MSTEYNPADYDLAIYADDLSITTGSGEHLVSDVNLKINQGDRVTIEGRSGAGKSLVSTALCGIRYREARGAGRVMNTVRNKAMSGAAMLGFNLGSQKNYVSYGGDVSYVMTPRDGGEATLLPHTFNILHQNIGFVPQEPLLDGNRTARDNILSPSRLKELPIDYDQLEEISEELGITKLLGKKAGELSGGQKQLISLARSLMPMKNALILDEPTANLNPKLKGDINVMLSRLNERYGVSIISVTHEPEFTLAERWIEMREGRIVSDKIDDPIAHQDNYRRRKAL